MIDSGNQSRISDAQAVVAAAEAVLEIAVAAENEADLIAEQFRNIIQMPHL